MSQARSGANGDAAEIEPILATIVLKRLEAIGEEMGYALMRSARSNVLADARDFSVGIYDPAGTLLHQTEYIPILGYAAAPAMKQIVEYYGDDVAPGDVVMHNDVFTGGNQLADVKVAKPVFVDGELLAWTVINAHQIDIGGGVAGGYNPHAREIWQEALRITPVKVYEGGKRRRDVWDLVLANLRLPIVGDDLEAAIGGCSVGERALQELAGRYGVAELRRYCRHLLGVADEMAKADISRWPDGTYVGEAEGTYDGVNPGSTMRVKVTMTVAGDHLTIDFEGTDPQTPGYVNAPRATTLSAVLIALYMCLDSNLPHNEGLLRAVDVLTPKGSIVDAEFPAATGFGNHLGDHIIPALMRALAQIVPEQVTAGWNNMVAGICSYDVPGKSEPFINFMLAPCKGGGGATIGADGWDHVGIVGAGGVIGTVDPELWEIGEPHFIRKFEFIPDSGGAGRWRGGLGVETEVEMIWPLRSASVIGDGEEEGTATPGILGGGDGSPNSLELTLPDGESFHPRIKDVVTDLPPGTVWRQLAGGGGGIGDPEERSRELVARDVREGVVSERAARETYGWDPRRDGDQERAAQSTQTSEKEDLR